MEEAELLKERLQAITDKRKLQEEIAQKRLQVEEEKLKLQHLKKKALRERWLLDGLTLTAPQEQEQIKKQNQKDQTENKQLEKNIHRLEEEIESLEKQELQISANEKTILKKLKAVEKTSEDIIKAVKAEAQEESAEYIYSKIPDLPPSYRPSTLKKIGSPKIETEDEQSKKALFAMEINVEKDLKTGESTVLSTVPVIADSFKGKGVKVYDDGRKSVFAVCSDGDVLENGVEELTPFQVEDLLRKATESKSKSPTDYHEPVFSNQKRPTTPKMPFRQPASPRLHEPQTESVRTEPNISRSSNAASYGERQIIQQNEDCFFDFPETPVKMSQFQRPQMTRRRPPSNKHFQDKLTQSHVPLGVQNKLHTAQIPCHEAKENHCEAMFLNSEYSNGKYISAFEEDIRYNIVQEMPPNIDTDEPVTMIFMGYQHVDDAEGSKQASSYEGAIRAELVVIGDEDDDDDDMPSYHPEGPYSQVYQPPSHLDTGHHFSEARINLNMNNVSPYKNSISLKEQEADPNNSFYKALPDEQLTREVTEDPSIAALRMRMAKLGKRVM